MRFNAYVIAAALLWQVTATAQELTLDAPTTAQPGTLVVLDASIIPASGRTWSAVNVPEDSYRVVDDGERLVFATAKPGRYWIFDTAGISRLN